MFALLCCVASFGCYSILISSHLYGSTSSFPWISIHFMKPRSSAEKVVVIWVCLFVLRASFDQDPQVTWIYPQTHGQLALDLEMTPRNYSEIFWLTVCQNHSFDELKCREKALIREHTFSARAI